MGQRWRLRFKTKARLTCHRGSLGRILVQPDSPCPTPLSIRLRLEIPWGRRQTEEARVRYWQGGLVPWVCPEPSHGSWGDWGRPAIPLPTKYFLSTYCWLTTLLGPVRSAGKRTEKKVLSLMLLSFKRISACSPGEAWKSEWHLESPHLSLPHASGPRWQQLNSDAGRQVWEQGPWGSHSETPTTCDGVGEHPAVPEGCRISWERERQKGEGFTSGTERMPQTQPHTLYLHSAIKIPVDSGGKRCRQLEKSELFPLSRRQF